MDARIDHLRAVLADTKARLHALQSRTADAARAVAQSRGDLNMALLEEAGIVCGETVVHVANTWIPSADRKFYGQNRGKEATRFLVLGAFGTGRLNIVKVKKDGTPSQSPNGLHGIIEVAHLVKAEATP